MNENKLHCKSIAETLEQIANGEIMRCPICGEEININDWEDFDLEDGGFIRECGHCHEKSDGEDWEEVTLFDYFESVLDIEYRVNSNKEYKSVSLMVACGGPNIYIDTAAKMVKLYWWNEYADYMIDSDVCEAIDSMFEELYNC